jgi:hypothetical protein
MPRPVKPIDQIGMQKIVDEIQPGQFGNTMALCSYVAERYNNEIFPHNSSAQVDHQLVKLRMTGNNPVIKLAFPLPVGRRGRQKGVSITSEQKEKMQAGRINKKKVVVTNDKMELWQQNMKEDFAGKKILCDGLLAGKKNSAIKAMCINCMGGYKNRVQFSNGAGDPPLTEAIRDCRGYSCPLYLVRPFQKKESE